MQNFYDMNLYDLRRDKQILSLQRDKRKFKFYRDLHNCTSKMA